MAVVLLAQKALGHVLEMGCGPCRFSALLLKKSTSLTCTDLSDEMLAVARGYMDGSFNVTLQKADCTDCGFASGSFDTVVMMNLIHVLEHPLLALAEDHRLLRSWRGARSGRDGVRDGDSRPNEALREVSENVGTSSTA